MAKILHPTFGSCELRMLEITYHCDFADPAAKTIPLGVMGDILVPQSSKPIYGLGLIARSALDDAEANEIGALARPMLSEPFKFLENEFERVWADVDPKKAFIELSSASHSAIVFKQLEPIVVTIPLNLAKHVDEDREALKSWSLDQLRSIRDVAYWDLIGRLWAKSPADRGQLLHAA